MLFNLLQTDIVEEVAGAVEAVPQQEVMSMSLIEMATKGGWLMIVLLLLSIVALYIFGKKCWCIRQAGKIDRTFIADLRDYIHDGKTKSALTLCAHYDSPMARIAEAGIRKIGKETSEIQATMDNAGSIEVGALEKGLPYLATIAGGAPMIGFLGTVLGMVQAFFNMSKAGNNIDITLLSSGIYTAMITTVGGLIVGILAYFGYNYLTARISDLVIKMEGTSADVIDIINNTSSEQ
ncbi:MAG: MotA/TolQ/ExbB proton channel family protein [Bacteroidales bacterium]|nr:MotA/TolQ/ExbB proton channel family protein [Bacteroidales bacterium]